VAKRIDRTLAELAALLAALTAGHGLKLYLQV
jgi:hypothetical protein